MVLNRIVKAADGSSTTGFNPKKGLSDLFVYYNVVEPQPKAEKLEEQKEEEPEPVRRWHRMSEFFANYKPVSERPEQLPETATDLDDETKDDSEFRENIQWYYYSPDFVYTPDMGTGKYSRGNLQAEIEKLFKDEGLNIKVTSGKRSFGAIGKSKISYHTTGDAVDIVPGEGETFDSLKSKMLSSPAIRKFFYENQLGVIDETIEANKLKTGATGDHFHIGPDQWAVGTWSNWLGTHTDKIEKPQAGDKEGWAKWMYDLYKKALRKEFGNDYSQDDYDRIAWFMTAQSANESGWGQSNMAAHNNYGGHKRGKTGIAYDTVENYLAAQMKTLRKWPSYIKAKSLKEYIQALYTGDYRYCTSQTEDEYYKMINGTTPSLSKWTGVSYHKYGGKFANLRMMSDGLDIRDGKRQDI